MNIDLDLSLWPRQMMAFKSKATEILFGGASEGGKSHFVRVLLIVLCLAIPGLQCVLIRKKYADIIANHVEGPTGFKALLAPLIEAKAVKVTQDGVFFPKGSRIAFKHCQDERQFDSAQGVESHVLVVDEATQIKAKIINFFRAWCRMPKEMRDTLPAEYRDKLPLIVYTANPIGPSTGFFRRNFVKARAPFEIEEVHGFLRQYIPSKAEDNKSVDLKAHKGRLGALEDQALAEALDTGNWDAPIGDFFRGYDDEKHTTPDFTPPPGWFNFASFDWGSSEPFSVLWWTVSDGNEFKDHLGRKRWFPRGALIAYREWHGCDPADPAKGLELRNTQITAGIQARTTEKWSGLVLTDSLPFQDRGDERNGQKYKIADVFRDAGLPLTRANTARVYGCKQIKDRLAGIDGKPLIYFCESCRYVREYLPAIERDELQIECCVDHGEASHSVDIVRYACTAKPLVLEKSSDSTKPPGEAAKITPSAILQQLQTKKTNGGGYSFRR